jgi:Bifunctional DNA primase/polymerase, N-terminal
MSFYEDAKKYVAMGMWVFPIRHRSKIPLTDNGVKDASNYIPQLKSWGLQYPDAGIAIAGRDINVGDIGILEFDQKPTLSSWAKEYGQAVPTTRTHISGGKKMPHFLFTQTEYSLSLGNCAAMGDYCTIPDCPNGKKKGGLHKDEWFSWRVYNRYVIAPPSISPDTGDPYTVFSDAPILPIPDWLVDALRAKGRSEKQAGKEMGAHPVSLKFDFEKLVAWLGVQVQHVNGAWHGLDVCPAAGYRHEGQNDISCAFWWDGDEIGFKCHAQGCPSNTERRTNGHMEGGMGCLMRIMQSPEKLGRYEGEIWEQETIAQTLAAFDVDELDGIVRVTPEITITTTPAATIVAPAPTEAQPVEAHPLAFPEECTQDDNLGDWARMTEMPLSLAYPAMLACVSVKPYLTRMADARVNIYCALLVKPGGGKNEVIRRALVVSGLTPKTDYMKTAPGGDAQLSSMLGDKAKRRAKDSPEEREPGPAKMLMVTNEIGDVLSKTTIDNSTLASRLCDMWDDSEFTKPVGRDRIEVNCRLSWLGGMPVWLENTEKFSEFMGGETNFGLYPRFIFGYGDADYIYSDWLPVVAATSQTVVADSNLASFDSAVSDGLSDFNNDGVTVVQRLSDEARSLYDAWMPENEHRGRLRYNAKKIAVLKAAFNGEREVTAQRMRQAIMFMEWQIVIRGYFQPGTAKESNKEAWFVDRLVPALERAGACEKFVSWRRISLDNRWDRRIDPGVQLRTVQGLVELGRLIEEAVDDEKRKEAKASGRKRVYPKVKLRNY